MVEERTGFRVAVTPKPDLSTHASMQSATAALPVHQIFVNPKYENVADYLVAMQCAMLLLKWSDPEHVVDFQGVEGFLNFAAVVVKISIRITSALVRWWRHSELCIQSCCSDAIDPA